MKNLVAIAIIIFLSFGFTSNASAQKTDMDKITVHVDGLGCPFCAYGLEKKMQEMDGVKKFKIKMENGETSFLFPSEASITIEAIEAQVFKAGYTPVSTLIERADGTIVKNEHKEEVVAVDYEADAELQLTVHGTCDMCKKRIEKAALSLYGVSEAKWNKKSKVLSINYLSNELTEKDIHLQMVKTGHDTDKAISNENVYDNLPPCCQYDRVDVAIEFKPEVEGIE